ncbi:MAG: hypothetical protein OEM15_17435 [Myxococcales bacterium]|nr:hypothetical protein [Myxococcales bacterium]MDH3485557.1 hypothetical protein [Myxococcales bacterium]
MDRSLKQLLGVATLGGIAYVVFFVPFDGQTPYEHVAELVNDGVASAKESVQIDDGQSAFPHADETLRLEDADEGVTYAPNRGENNPGRNLNKKIYDAAQRREQRRQRRQDGWQ